MLWRQVVTSAAKISAVKNVPRYLGTTKQGDTRRMERRPQIAGFSIRSGRRSRVLRPYHNVDKVPDLVPFIQPIAHVGAGSGYVFPIPPHAAAPFEDEDSFVLIFVLDQELKVMLTYKRVVSGPMRWLR